MLRRIIFSVVLICSLWAGFAQSGRAVIALPEAAAEALPDDAVRTLHEVLSQEQYQPRRIPQTSWERFKKDAWQWLSRKWSEFWDSIPFEKLRLPPNSALGKFFVWFAGLVYSFVEFFRPVFTWWRELLAASACLVLAIYGYRYYSRRRRPAARTKPKSARNQTAPAPTIEEIVQLGPTAAGLALFRELLRRELHANYSLPPSVTDREICRKLPPQDGKGKIFSGIAGLFERVAFAGGALDAQRFTALLQEYTGRASQLSGSESGVSGVRE